MKIINSANINLKSFKVLERGTTLSHELNEQKHILLHMINKQKLLISHICLENVMCANLNTFIPFRKALSTLLLMYRALKQVVKAPENFKWFGENK